MTAECEHKHERRTQEIKTMCDFDVIWGSYSAIILLLYSNLVQFYYNYSSVVEIVHSTTPLFIGLLGQSY